MKASSRKCNRRDTPNSTINDIRGSLCVGYAGTAAALSQRPFALFRGSASMLPVPFAYVYGQAVATDGTQIVGMAAEGDTERGVGASHAVLWDLLTGQATDLGRDSSVYGVGGGVQVGTRVGSRGATAGLWRGTGCRVTSRTATSWVSLRS